MQFVDFLVFCFCVDAFLDAVLARVMRAAVPIPAVLLLLCCILLLLVDLS